MPADSASPPIAPDEESEFGRQGGGVTISRPPRPPHDNDDEYYGDDSYELRPTRDGVSNSGLPYLRKNADEGYPRKNVDGTSALLGQRMAPPMLAPVVLPPVQQRAMSAATSNYLAEQAGGSVPRSVIKPMPSRQQFTTSPTAALLPSVQSPAGLTPEGGDVAEALVVIAKTYTRHERYEDAVTMMERAFAARQSAYGVKDARTAKVAVLLGALYRRCDRLDQAGRLLFAAFKATVANYGTSHIDVGKAAWQLGIVYEEQGQFADAESAYVDAVGIIRGLQYRVLNPPSDPNEAPLPFGATKKVERRLGRAITSLFLLLRKLGQLAEADAAVQRAARLRNVESTPLVSPVSSQLLVIEAERDKLVEAESAYTRALELQGLYGIRIGYSDGQTPGWQDLPIVEEADVGAVLVALGNVLRKQDRLEEAEETLTRAIRVLIGSVEAHGRVLDKRELGSALSALAIVHRKQGRTIEADREFERSSQIMEEIGERV